MEFCAGDLLDSDAEALVNTVNCAGVMGKGIALQFKRRYPRMYHRYVELCRKNEVVLGRPYMERERDRVIINFPTKGHWKSQSRLGDVRNGLAFLRKHIEQWGIRSIAIPALGCGNGGLLWRDVRPIMLDALSGLSIEVQIYVPEDSEEAEAIRRTDDAHCLSEATHHEQLGLFQV